MRKIYFGCFFVILLAGLTFEVQAQNWTIVPGRSVGKITSRTSEKDLIRLYGKANVKRMAIDVGEGETQNGTVLFPGDPRKRAFILWHDPDKRLRPESVSIRNKNALWRTNRGITIGTSLRTIEALNGGAFALTGFAWDYEGTVLHSNGGKMRELGVNSDEEITGRTLLLRLSPSMRSRETAEYQKVLGDGMFLSSNQAMRKLNPTVYEMIIQFL